MREQYAMLSIVVDSFLRALSRKISCAQVKRTTIVYVKVTIELICSTKFHHWSSWLWSRFLKWRLFPVQLPFHNLTFWIDRNCISVRRCQWNLPSSRLITLIPYPKDFVSIVKLGTWGVRFTTLCSRYLTSANYVLRRYESLPSRGLGCMGMCHLDLVLLICCASTRTSIRIVFWTRLWDHCVSLFTVIAEYIANQAYYRTL